MKCNMDDILHNNIVSMLNFSECNNSNAIVLKGYMRKCLGLKCHDICKLLPNGSAKNLSLLLFVSLYIYIYTQRDINHT